MGRHVVNDHNIEDRKKEIACCHGCLMLCLDLPYTSNSYCALVRGQTESVRALQIRFPVSVSYHVYCLGVLS